MSRVEIKSCLLPHLCISELADLAIEFVDQFLDGDIIWIFRFGFWWLGRVCADGADRFGKTSDCAYWGDRLQPYCARCDPAAFQKSCTVHEITREYHATQGERFGPTREYDLTTNPPFVYGRDRHKVQVHRALRQDDPIHADLADTLCGKKDDVKWCAGRDLPRCVHDVRT